MHVRPLLPSDRSQWDPLWQGYLEFYEQSLDDAVTAQTFERLVGDDPALVGLVAVDGDQLVGLCHLVLHPSTWTSAPCCYLEDLFVRPDRRGAGAGRALLDAATATAHCAGAGKLYWQTHEGNVTARRLYDSVAAHHGFVVYESPLDG